MVKFKVGDIVKPNDNMSTHPLGYLVLARMLEGKVVSVGDHNVDVLITKAKAGLEKHKGDKIGYFSEERFDLVYRKQELHVTSDGTTTHAVLKEGGKVVKRAKAVCSPDDEYSFETGARLAIDRVFGKEEKKDDPQEPKFKFEVGAAVGVNAKAGCYTHPMASNFIKQFGEEYLARFAYGGSPSKGLLYVVRQRAEWTDLCGRKRKLYVIEETDLLGLHDGAYYIVEEEGLKKGW